MELTKTEKLIKEFEVNLKKNLQALLIKEGHVDTGNLLKSISVITKKDSSGNFKIELSALDYIKYLDKDSMLPKYLKIQIDIFTKKLSEEISKDILNSII